jgi:hypothetical protein
MAQYVRDELGRMMRVDEPGNGYARGFGGAVEPYTNGEFIQNQDERRRVPMQNPQNPADLMRMEAGYFMGRADSGLGRMDVRRTLTMRGTTVDQNGREVDYRDEFEYRFSPTERENVEEERPIEVDSGRSDGLFKMTMYCGLAASAVVLFVIALSH